ncbi:hypothetical protein MW887_007221 [Aspergillus wentii]|nr:hypothetical protein MW887_007221 [Aspergillus wentii]
MLQRLRKISSRSPIISPEEQTAVGPPWNNARLFAFGELEIGGLLFGSSDKDRSYFIVVNMDIPCTELFLGGEVHDFPYARFLFEHRLHFNLEDVASVSGIEHIGSFLLAGKVRKD